jgi:hypothetical protein
VSRMLLALALFPAAAPAEEADPSPQATAVQPATLSAREACKDSKFHKVMPPGEPPKLRTLDREPEAEAYFTVLRIDDGCDKPVLVRERR